MADEEIEYARVRRFTLAVCEACIGGEGATCCTPGCAFWMDQPPDETTRAVLGAALADATPATRELERLHTFVAEQAATIDGLSAELSQARSARGDGSGAVARLWRIVDRDGLPTHQEHVVERDDDLLRPSRWDSFAPDRAPHRVQWATAPAPLIWTDEHADPKEATQ